MNQIAITMAGKAAWTDENVLDRILTLLRTVAAAIQKPPQYNSFVEENLLDPRLGPEISRALR